MLHSEGVQGGGSEDGQLSLEGIDDDEIDMVHTCTLYVYFHLHSNVQMPVILCQYVDVVIRRGGKD